MNCPFRIGTRANSPSPALDRAILKWRDGDNIAGMKLCDGADVCRRGGAILGVDGAAVFRLTHGSVESGMFGNRSIRASVDSGRASVQACRNQEQSFIPSHMR